MFRVSLRYRRLRLKFQPEIGCVRTVILLSLLGEYQWMLCVQDQLPLSQDFPDKILPRDTRFLWKFEVKHIIRHLLTIPIAPGIFHITEITLYSREISITKLLVQYILILLSKFYIISIFFAVKYTCWMFPSDSKYLKRAKFNILIYKFGDNVQTEIFNHLVISKH